MVPRVDDVDRLMDQLGEVRWGEVGCCSDAGGREDAHGTLSHAHTKLHSCIMILTLLYF